MTPSARARACLALLGLASLLRCTPVMPPAPPTSCWSRSSARRKVRRRFPYGPHKPGDVAGDDRAAAQSRLHPV